jgi:hypothetical protein
MGIGNKDCTHARIVLRQQDKSQPRRTQALLEAHNDKGKMMATIHSVEVSWEDLLGAFTSGQLDKAHYLDRLTGEIFSVPATAEGTEVLQQLQNNGERFLEIPPFDYRSERQILAEFVTRISDPELQRLLSAALAGKKPYGKIEDILSFYPGEEDRFTLMKDNFLSDRLKTWMEENNLFTADAVLQSAKHP